MTTTSYPIAGVNISHAQWRDLFEVGDGSFASTSLGFSLTLSSVSDTATVGVNKFRYRGYVLQVTVPHNLTVPPASGSAKTYQVGIMYNPALESDSLGPLALSIFDKTAVTIPPGGSWKPLKEITRQPSQTLNLATVVDLQQWSMPPVYRTNPVLPPAVDYSFGQVLLQQVGTGTPDVLVRTGTPGTESWTSLLRPKWVTVNPVSSVVVASGLTGRVTKAGGRVYLEGSFRRSTGAVFAANTFYSILTLPTGYGPDRDQQQFVNTGFDNSGSGGRLMIDSSTRAVTFMAPYDTSFVSLDGVSFFPAEA